MPTVTPLWPYGAATMPWSDRNGMLTDQARLWLEKLFKTVTIHGSGPVQLGGDIGGTSASPIVIGLQTRPLSATTPVNGQVITWSSTDGAWEPKNPTGTQADWAAASGPSQILNKPPITWDGTTIRNNANTTVTAGYVLAVNSPDNSRYFSIYINDANYHPVLHSSSGKIGIDTNTRLEIYGGDFFIYTASFDRFLQLSMPAGGNPTFTASTGLLLMNNDINVLGGHTLTWFSPDGTQTGTFNMPAGDDFTIHSTTNNIKMTAGVQAIYPNGLGTTYIWLHFLTAANQPTITAAGGDGSLHFATAASFDSGLSAASIGQNKVFAGPASGTGTAVFRALAAADLPAGTGSVTSVGLAAPAEFTVSGSPVTGSGVLTFAKATQAANTVYAGPTTGAATQPAFRAQVAADVPQVIKVNGVLRG